MQAGLEKPKKKVQGFNLDTEVIDFLEQQHLKSQAASGERISFSQYVNNILLSYKRSVERKSQSAA